MIERDMDRYRDMIRQKLAQSQQEHKAQMDLEACRAADRIRAEIVVGEADRYARLLQAMDTAVIGDHPDVRPTWDPKALDVFLSLLHPVTAG